jgi:hypothetical protein
VLEQWSSNEVVVESSNRLTGVNETERLERRFIVTFEQERLTNFELSRRGSNQRLIEIPSKHREGDSLEG